MDRGACPVPGEAKDSMPAVSHEFVAAGWWYTYTSEKYESQLGWWHSQYMENKHVPNHQPGCVFTCLCHLSETHANSSFCVKTNQVFGWTKIIHTSNKFGQFGIYSYLYQPPFQSWCRSEAVLIFPDPWIIPGFPMISTDHGWFLRICWYMVQPPWNPGFQIFSSDPSLRWEW